MSDDRKVIPISSKMKSKPPEDRRTSAMATLALILFMVLGFNFSMFDLQLGAPGADERKIASVPTDVANQWKKNIETLGKDQVVSASKAAAPTDHLHFGALEGKYDLTVKEGRVEQIHFSDLQKSQPLRISDRLGFLEKYASVLAPGYRSIEKTKVEKTAAGTREVFRVVYSEKSATIEIELDGYERFLSLQTK